jgi:hypothetical protein
MNRFVTSAALVILVATAACSGEKREPAANEAANGTANTTANEAAPPAAAVPSLVGEWTVTQINGKASDQVWPMIARVTPDRFTIASECRKMAWSFHQDRNVVHLEADSAGSAECGRVRSPAENAVEKPVGLANIAMFSDRGRSVELSGPGGRVTMTRR